MPFFLSAPLKRALLRAGAYGARHARIGGYPEVGVGVPIQPPQSLADALDTLRARGVRATLIVSPSLALTQPERLAQAAKDGHEIAGQGKPELIPLLDVAAQQAVTLWDPAGRGCRDLAALAALAVYPLPFAQNKAEPGQVLSLKPDTLGQSLDELLRLGYQPKPIGALRTLRPAQPRDLLFALYTRLVEDRFTRQGHVITLSGRPDANMRVAPLDHAPPPLPLPRHTPTAELHLHSARLVGQAQRSPAAAYRASFRSLRDVALALEQHPDLRSAQAVFAVTLLHAPLAQAGFTMVDLPPLRARWYGLGFRLLRVAYGTTAAPGEPLPRLAWMTREAFLTKYGSARQGAE